MRRKEKKREKGTLRVLSINDSIQSNLPEYQFDYPNKIIGLSLKSWLANAERFTERQKIKEV